MCWQCLREVLTQLFILIAWGAFIYIIIFFFFKQQGWVRPTGLLSIVAFKPIRLGQENSCGLRCKNNNKKAPRLHGQTYKAAQTNRGWDSAVSLSGALRCYQLLRFAGSTGLKAVSKQHGGSWWLRVWGEVETLPGHFRLLAFLLPATVAVFFLATAFSLSRSAARACSSGQAAVPAAGLCPPDALRFQKSPALPRAPKSPPASLSRSKTMSGMEVC